MDYAKNAMYLKTENAINKGSELCISYGLSKGDDGLFMAHGFCERPGINKNSTVQVDPKDILLSLEPSRKLALWAYAKKSSKKFLKYNFSLQGPSEDLFFDLAILSGAKAAQVKMMLQTGEKPEDILEILDKTKQTIVKVLRTKLRQLYMMDNKDFPGKEIRMVHFEIIQRNLIM
ncbi:unnamed protein product [Oikopleura dioica]|uniref:Rubisco LSMT substrate-binding domain-containing protein n=1 Tax=Oikopleura dioica TaxID=34765 RepID=E4XBG8_OIKDI|nr:unnamed protein product [Oikopleura dioica]CBY33765.1 unnamed protein product [Oikopleura dioica]